MTRSCIVGIRPVPEAAPDQSVPDLHQLVTTLPLRGGSGPSAGERAASGRVRRARGGGDPRWCASLSDADHPPDFDNVCV